jgi:acetylornithine deacetylase/succinyl-diaminopimelate desuccinylase-like protein
VGFDALEFHERAVRTPSHEDVGPMRDLLCETLRDGDVEPRVDDAGNVRASRGPADGDPHVVLNTHIDTVPPHVPFAESASEGGEDGDVVHGRGACDAKGPLAALLEAFLAVDPAGQVTLAVTPDEETLSTGAAALAFGDSALDADGYVVGEPTGLDVCNAAKGRFQATVTVRGNAAHAAEPDSGVNAVRGAAPLLEALDGFDHEHGPGSHESLGDPTLQVTTIEGGAATNQVPAECRFTVDRRSVPPETAAGFREALGAHLRAHASSDLDVAFALTDREPPFLEAFHTPADDPLVRALADASGGDIRPFGAATEASYFAADAPTVVFGPGDLADDEGAVAHSDREYVRRSDVERAAAVLRRALEAVVG